MSEMVMSGEGGKCAALGLHAVCAVGLMERSKRAKTLRMTQSVSAAPPVHGSRCVYRSRTPVARSAPRRAARSHLTAPHTVTDRSSTAHVA